MTTNIMNKDYYADITEFLFKSDFTDRVSETCTLYNGVSEVQNSGTQRPKICENLLLESFRYWFPMGTLDPIVLSYLILAIRILFSKCRIFREWKVKFDRCNKDSCKTSCE